ncbi:hypothetical protein BDR05DRAFT_996462 [Suillus weaverae]|nr:hypothetical protein BDR05DRAFT_996462 [Suillus weaverae]
MQLLLSPVHHLPSSQYIIFHPPSTSSSILPSIENAPPGPPPSSVDPESLGPTIPSTFLSPSTEGSATLLAQQEGTETMKNLVEVVREMQKNLVLVPPQPQPQPSSTHVGSAISLLNKCANLTSKEHLAIANFLAEHENQAIIFYSLDEVTRLEWLEEK